MQFITLAIRNITRRPGRSALTVCGLAVALAAVMSLVGFVRSFERSLRDVYEARGIDLVVIRAAGLYRSSATLPEALGERIGGLSGVRGLSPCLTETVSFEAEDFYGVSLQGFPHDSFLLADLKMVDGRCFQSDDRRVVVLGKVVAENLNKTVGDVLEVLPGEPFKVIGVFQSFTPLENGWVVMPLADLQKLMDRGGEVSGFLVRTEHGDPQLDEQLTRQIKALAPQLDVLPAREYLDTAIEMRLARAMSWLTSAVALVVGSIGMLNNMLTAVFERTREIAILRAIGWRKARVMKLILLESFLLALGALLLGTLAAIALNQTLSRYPAVQHIISGEIAPVVMLQAGVIAILICLLSGTYPAYRAAQLLPTEGLRQG